MRVASIHVYPIKSLGGYDVERIQVEPWGLAGDRRWMLVEPDGHFITARKERRLLQATALPVSEGLEVSAPALPTLTLHPPTDRPTMPVQVWSSHLDATPASGDADEWFTALLGRPVRLVWLDDPTRRPTNPEYSESTDRVTFADGYPVHATTTGSLRQLNEWIEGDPVPMSRFRPGLVIDSDEAFTEDRWRQIMIGDVPFRMVKLCDRCVMTTIDPSTLAKSQEPLRALAKHRRWDQKLWFGVNLIPDVPGPAADKVGEIAVEDRVTTV